MSVALAFGDSASDVASRIAVLEREGFSRRLWSRTRRCGAWIRSIMPWRATASAGSTSPPACAPGPRRSGASRPRSCATASLTPCCSAWADRASAPEVMRQTLGRAPGAVALTVLDSTSPAAVRAVASSHDPERTLFVVSSKSGGTLEVVSLEAFFHDWVAAVRGAGARSGVRRDHRPRHLARTPRSVARLPPRVHEPGRHRRPLLGAVVLRTRPGRTDRRRSRGDARRRRARGQALRARRARDRESRRSF